MEGWGLGFHDNPGLREQGNSDRRYAFADFYSAVGAYRRFFGVELIPSRYLLAPSSGASGRALISGLRAQ
jgi:hypothetical protein